MATRNYFMNGITDLLILSILENHDCYAYEITRTIRQSSDSRLSISQNTVYAATYKLKDEGMVSEYSKLVGKRRTRIYYHIEEKGIQHLKKIRENYLTTTSGVDAILFALQNDE